MQPDDVSTCLLVLQRYCAYQHQKGANKRFAVFVYYYEYAQGRCNRNIGQPDHLANEAINLPPPGRLIPVPEPSQSLSRQDHQVDLLGDVDIVLPGSVHEGICRLAMASEPPVAWPTLLHASFACMGTWKQWIMSTPNEIPLRTPPRYMNSVNRASSPLQPPPPPRYS